MTERNYLTASDLDEPQYLGVPAAWLGEDGDAIAITADERRGLAAIHAMARHDLGGASCATAAGAGWARFWIDGDPDEWLMEPCQPGDVGAISVVIAREVIDRKSLEV